MALCHCANEILRYGMKLLCQHEFGIYFIMDYLYEDAYAPYHLFASI